MYLHMYSTWTVPLQALPSGDLEALLQQHPEMLMTSGMGRAPSFNMAKLESMELPDAVAAVVRNPFMLIAVDSAHLVSP